ncbi:MAG: hypothetical protein GY711_35550 [bacterium]|nr:hypothetical protein [bacterium]
MPSPKSRSWLLLLAWTAGCGALPRSEPADATQAALTRVREALGTEQAATVALRGHVAGNQAGTTFEDVYDSGGPFRRTVASNLAVVTGHDGETTWKLDAHGAQRPLALGSAADVRYHAWLEGGAWADPELDAFEVRVIEDEEVDDIVLEVRGTDGHFRARVTVDAETALPETIERTSEHGRQSTRFGDWRTVGGRRFPFEIEHESPAGNALRYVVSEAEVLQDGDELFEPSAHAPTDTRFHPERRARIPARQLATGHIVVQARLDDLAPVWFLLDTGAGRNLLHDELSNELGWSPLGQALVSGTGGQVVAPILGGGRLDVGRASIEGLPWIELDLDFLEKRLGIPLGGVLGYDVFARAVVEIDWALGTVGVHDPARYPAPDETWLELLFDDTAPCVQASFAPGREGWFRLDTGSDDTVAFHTSTVKKLGLGARIDGARPVRVEGVGGETVGSRGRLDWFELGALRFHAPRVTLVEDGWGALDDPYLAGNLGTGFLRRARIVLHYPARRVQITEVEELSLLIR